MDSINIRTLQQKWNINFVITKQNSQVNYDDRGVYKGDCRTNHYPIWTDVFFPCKTRFDNEMDCDNMHELRFTMFRLKSLQNDSTTYLYQSRLELKLRSIFYSSGLDKHN